MAEKQWFKPSKKGKWHAVKVYDGVPHLSCVCGEPNDDAVYPSGEWEKTRPRTGVCKTCKDRLNGIWG